MAPLLCSIESKRQVAFPRYVLKYSYIKRKRGIKEAEPEFIYLFGSYATGEARSESDIDIAIYLNNQISAYELF